MKFVLLLCAALSTQILLCMEQTPEQKAKYIVCHPSFPQDLKKIIYGQKLLDFIQSVNPLPLTPDDPTITFHTSNPAQPTNQINPSFALGFIADNEEGDAILYQPKTINFFVNNQQGIYPAQLEKNKFKIIPATDNTSVSILNKENGTESTFKIPKNEDLIEPHENSNLFITRQMSSLYRPDNPSDQLVESWRVYCQKDGSVKCTELPTTSMISIPSGDHVLDYFRKDWAHSTFAAASYNDLLAITFSKKSEGNDVCIHDESQLVIYNISCHEKIAHKVMKSHRICKPLVFTRYVMNLIEKENSVGYYSQLSRGANPNGHYVFYDFATKVLGTINTTEMIRQTNYFFTSLDDYQAYLKENNWVLEEEQTKLLNDAHAHIAKLKEKADEPTLQKAQEFLKAFKKRTDKIKILWLTQNEETKQNPFKELHELVKKLSNNNYN